MIDAATLTHHLERTLTIRATRETVFSFFTDPARWAAWWGAGSTIEPRPGGRIFIRYPEGTEAAGRIVEIAEPSRLVFTYGYANGVPIPEGGSIVTIELSVHRHGTELRLTHAFADEGVRDQHVQGWRYQLSLFANLVANEFHAGATSIADRWFAAWSEADTPVRETAITEIVAKSIAMRDQFSAIEGVPDLLAHLSAARHFMPGVRLRRQGAVRHCQGLALADWELVTSEGAIRGAGTNVFELDATGRIASVTGFWGAAPSAGDPA
jgi:uncharacterized protein YndB with AHSA1/START domain